MNYIETCTKIAVFFVMVEQLSTSKINSTCPTGVNYISKYAETWEKKVMKFEREIPIGLMHGEKKRQGGGHKARPPNGIRVNPNHYLYTTMMQHQCTELTVKSQHCKRKVCYTQQDECWQHVE